MNTQKPRASEPDPYLATIESVCSANGIDSSKFVRAADALLSRAGVYEHQLRADDLDALHIVDVREEQSPYMSEKQWLVEIGVELTVGRDGLTAMEAKRFLGETIRADEKAVFVSVGTRVPDVLLNIEEDVGEATTQRFGVDSRAFQSAISELAQQEPSQPLIGFMKYLARSNGRRARLLAADVPRSARELVTVRQHQELASRARDGEADAAIADLELDEPARRLFSGESHGVAFIATTGALATSLWHDLVARAERTHYWPVVLGGSKETLAIDDGWEYYASLVAEGEGEGSLPESWYAAANPSAVLSRANKLDFAAYRARLDGSWVESAPPRGPWPEKASGADPILPGVRELSSGEFLPRVYIALVPAKEAWMVPAYLPVTQVGESYPSNTSLVVILRHYHQQHGARLATMIGATVAVHVLSSPPTRDKAIEMMLEWYDFDRDAFADGQTIDELAHHYMHDPLWGWWWD